MNAIECRKGHVLTVANRMDDTRCRICSNERNRRHYVRHAKKILAKQSEYYRRNPSKQHERGLKYVSGHPGAYRDDHLRRTYGMDLTAYGVMLKAQGGVCGICGKHPGSRSLHVDHDHRCCPGTRSCGKCIRGLLCNYCNRYRIPVVEGGFVPAIEAYLARKAA